MIFPHKKVKNKKNMKILIGKKKNISRQPEEVGALLVLNSF